MSNIYFHNCFPPCRLKKDEIRQKNLRELKLKKEAFIQKIFDKDKKEHDRLNDLLEKKREETRRKTIQLKMQMNYIKQKRFLMAKKEQQKILNTFKEWNDRDRRFRRRMEQMETNKHKEKMETAMKRLKN